MIYFQMVKNGKQIRKAFDALFLHMSEKQTLEKTTKTITNSKLFEEAFAIRIRKNKKVFYFYLFKETSNGNSKSY